MKYINLILIGKYINICSLFKVLIKVIYILIFIFISMRIGYFKNVFIVILNIVKESILIYIEIIIVEYINKCYDEC